ncbi:MAG TPA: helix-turn-helix transcriptional regulator [Actinomycetota bacterium]
MDGRQQARQANHVERDAAELLRHIRDEAVLSQRELARRAACSQQTIARIEAGQRQPSLALLQRLARAAGGRLRIEFEIVDPAVEQAREQAIRRRRDKALWDVVNAAHSS